VTSCSRYLGPSPAEIALTTVGVGLCTALGRASVIPVVPVVRARYAEDAPYVRRFSLR
jgi:hypothetical protein